MNGRYGIDQFNRFLLGFACVLLFIAVFLRGTLIYVGIFVRTISVITLLIFYYRMFSRKFDKRHLENNLYMKYKDRYQHFFKKIKFNLLQGKSHHIYRCPSCKQKIRVPRGKGKIQITCPKCQAAFIKKS